MVPLRDAPVGSEGHDVRVGGVWCRGEVEQVEDPSRGGGEVGGDRRDDAAGSAGDEHDGVGRQRHPAAGVGGAVRRAGRERLLQQGDAEASPVDAADLDASGVAQGLLDEQVGHGGRPPVDREVDRLDEGARALLLVGLGEAGHRTTERGCRAGGRVAVVPTESCGGHEEGVGLPEVAHRRVERLDPAAEGLVPGVQVVGRDVALVVQRREPVDAGDRTFRGPRGQLGKHLVGGRAGVEHQGGGARLAQSLDEGITDAALVAHDDDAGVAERHTGRQALVGRRAQRGRGDAPG